MFRFLTKKRQKQSFFWQRYTFPMYSFLMNLYMLIIFVRDHLMEAFDLTRLVTNEAPSAAATHGSHDKKDHSPSLMGIPNANEDSQRELETVWWRHHQRAMSVMQPGDRCVCGITTPQEYGDYAHSQIPKWKYYAKQCGISWLVRSCVWHYSANFHTCSRKTRPVCNKWPSQHSLMFLVNDCVYCVCSSGWVGTAAWLYLSLHMCRAQGISLIPQLSTGFAPHNGVVATASDPRSNSCAARHSGCRHLWKHKRSARTHMHVDPPSATVTLWLLSNTQI